PFFAYERIAGRALTSLDRSPELLTSLGRMLAELHGFPVARAATLLGTGSAELAWAGWFERLWPRIQRAVLPVLDRELERMVATEFTSFIALAPDLPRCLV